MSFFTLIEGLVSVIIKRPKQPLGYDYFEQIVNGTDIEFSFTNIRKDVHLETNKPIIVKLNNNTNPEIKLNAGIWDWTDEWVSKMYITTFEPTEIHIYAGG